MKKLSLVLFIMIALAGFGFADTKVILNGNVEEGGGVKPPNPGDESLSSGAIKSYLYYDVAGAGATGADSNSTSGLTSLSDGKTEHQLNDSFDLTGTKDDPDKLYLYIFAGANANSTGATLDITFSCTNGWVMSDDTKPADYEEQSIPLKFSTKTLNDGGALTASATDYAPSGTSSSAAIEITAAGNAREGTSKIVSRTEVSWKQAAYYVGNYSATITVSVEPSEV